MAGSVKKIFDIAPPRKKASAEVIPIKTPQKRSPSFFGNKLITILGGIVLIIALSLSYFMIPAKAKVEIWPQKNSFKETAAVTVSVKSEGKGLIKGEILKLEKTVSQNFSAQGKKIKSVKAQGAIRVYNNYSTISQPLVASTRFISDGGKLFRTPERVVVPGGHYEGGKLVAGFIDITVVADQPGEEYNIGESAFSIPGFAGTPKYTAFYAKSFSPMSGGSKKEVSYVSQQDIDEAKKFLSKTALEESDAALKKDVSSGKYILVDGAGFASVPGFQLSAELGQETPNFSASIKASAAALVFKESALVDFSKKYIEAKLAPGEKLIERFLAAEYSVQKTDLQKNEILLSLSISAQSHSVPEDVKIKELVKNKSAKEIEGVFSGLPQVARARVELWPFWINLAPDDFDRIEVVLHLD